MFGRVWQGLVVFYSFFLKGFVMAHERVEEARDVVKHIKDTHLMTWTNEEWDGWVRDHAGGRRDDALYLLSKVREAWGRDWPMVDFDCFMESYRMFGRDGVGGLRALLTPSRNRKGERLMENGGDNEVMRAVMRYVMGIWDGGDVEALRRGRVVAKGWVPGAVGEVDVGGAGRGSGSGGDYDVFHVVV